jgi:hypothetical protein
MFYVLYTFVTYLLTLPRNSLDLRFSWRWKLRFWFSELGRRVIWWVVTNVSEEPAVSIFRVPFVSD